MMPKRRRDNVRHFGLRWLAVSMLFIPWVSLMGQGVILHLRNGDRLTGTIISENTNEVRFSTALIKKVVVPIVAIERRESLPAVATVTNAPPPAPSQPAPPPIAVKPPKHWSGEAQVGMDAVFGQKDRQLYYGRIKAIYAKDRFKNAFDYNISYGKSDGVVSENRMDGSSKTEFNLGKRMFIYNLGGAGVDEIRKLDLRYEEGPGAGYHVITRSNLVFNVEAGANYQAQYFSDNTRKENFYFRLAEVLTWKINHKVTFDEKLEYFPQVLNLGQYRARFESNLKYFLLQNLSLNVTVLDQYESEPAAGVDKNDLQIRSSLGLKF